MSELSRGKIRGKERKEKWNEIKELRKEFRKRESKVVDSVVGQARVILATCHGSGISGVSICPRAKMIRLQF